MKFEDAYIEKNSKHSDYFEIYDEIFQGIDRNQELKILEIGVLQGHGLRALRRYFPNSKIFGLDINFECKEYESDGIEIVIGSQVDRKVLEYLKDQKLDIIIDDGSHDNNHVFPTFDFLFPHLNPENVGLYIVEDTHTSYWPQYNGFFRKEDSTIETFKKTIDAMHCWCIREPRFEHIPPYFGASVEKTYYEDWMKFVQFYENVIVVKKRKTPARCGSPK